MYIITEEDEKLLVTLGSYQQAVLRLLAEVPKGTVVTYGDLAKELAFRDSKYSPTASRAVGTTMKNNLCGPRIPCHRVIKSDGGLGNFRGGEPGAVKEKAQMLRDEGVEVVSNKINLKRFRHKFR
ncbi:MAG: MGMT family protein [Candidatus Heimdallarchaeota archaeon]